MDNTTSCQTGFSRWHRWITVGLCSQILVACNNSDGEAAFKQAVEVNSLNITALELISNNDIVEVGVTETFQAYGVVGGDTEDTVDVSRYVSWSSSDPSTITIDGGGTATAIADGSAEIRAQWADLQAGKLLTASSAALESIDVQIEGEPASISACSDSYRLLAFGNYQGESTPRDITSLVTWESADEAALGIDENGLLLAFQPGTTVVEASRENPDGSGVVRGALGVLVDNNLSSLVVGAETNSTNVGATLPFNAAADWSSGDTSDTEVTRTVTWRSDNGIVLSVSNELESAGLAEALSVGLASVTAECAGVVSNAFEVTVEEAIEITGVAINLGADNVRFTTNDSSPVELTAHFVLSDGSFGENITDDEDITWQVNDTNSGEPASVSNEDGSKGEVSFSAVGDTEIGVTYDDGEVNYKDDIDFIVSEP